MSTSATPQGITKQYKTKRDPHRRKDRIIDEPAYVDTIKSTKQIITAEKGLEIAQHKIQLAEIDRDAAQRIVFMEKAKDPDVIKCFLDWARGLRTCAHQKNIGDSIESYNLMHVPAIWVNALKEAGLAGKFVVDSEITFGRRDDRILLNTKAGPFQLRSRICYSHNDESYELIPEPHESFLKMLELCGVKLWLGA